MGSEPNQPIFTTLVLTSGSIDLASGSDVTVCQIGPAAQIKFISMGEWAPVFTRKETKAQQAARIFDPLIREVENE